MELVGTSNFPFARWFASLAIIGQRWDFGCVLKVVESIERRSSAAETVLTIYASGFVP